MKKNIILVVLGLLIILGLGIIIASKPFSGADERGGQSVSFEMVKSSRGYSYPQITEFANQEVKEKINKNLREKVEGYGCDQMNESYEFGYSSEPMYNDSGIWSIKSGGSYYCGGPYPDNFEDHTTFDLDTGEEIKFEDLFVDYESRKESVLSQIFAEQRKSDFWDENTESCLDEYAIDNLRTKEFPYFFDLDGDLVVSVNFPHVSSNCEVSVKLEKKKFSELKLSKYLERLNNK